MCYLFQTKIVFLEKCVSSLHWFLSHTCRRQTWAWKHHLGFQQPYITTQWTLDFPYVSLWAWVIQLYAITQRYINVLLYLDGMYQRLHIAVLSARKRASPGPQLVSEWVALPLWSCFSFCRDVCACMRLLNAICDLNLLEARWIREEVRVEKLLGVKASEKSSFSRALPGFFQMTSATL